MGSVARAMLVFGLFFVARGAISRRSGYIAVLDGMQGKLLNWQASRSMAKPGRRQLQENCYFLMQRSFREGLHDHP